MALSKDTLQKYLAYYGANIETWPDELQASAYKARKTPAYASLFKEEEDFERLLNIQCVESAHTELEKKIITAALTQMQYQKPEWWMYDIVMRIKPAAVAATLVLGFVIGFSALSSPITHSKQEMFSYSEDDGAIL